MPLSGPDVEELLRSVWQRSIELEGPHGNVHQRWLRRVCALLGWFSNALYCARGSCQQGRSHMDILSTVVSDLKAEIRQSDQLIAESNQLLGLGKAAGSGEPSSESIGCGACSVSVRFCSLMSKSSVT